MIPKIIHQTWKSKALTPEFRKWTKSWRRLNADWEWRLWDDDDCERLFTEHLPEFLPTYQALEKPVQKADLFRYAVLYVHGGVYADMDAVCVQPLEDWLRPDDELVLGVEFERGPHHSRRQYCQWTIASRAQHPSLYRVLRQVERNVATRDSLEPEWRRMAGAEAEDFVTIMLTGPMAWTEGIEEGRAAGEAMRILPVCAFNWNASCSADEILVQHQFLGSWKTKRYASAKQSGFQFTLRAGLFVAVIALILLMIFAKQIRKF